MMAFWEWWPPNKGPPVPNRHYVVLFFQTMQRIKIPIWKETIEGIGGKAIERTKHHLLGGGVRGPYKKHTLNFKPQSHEASVAGCGRFVFNCSDILKLNTLNPKSLNLNTTGRWWLATGILVRFRRQMDLQHAKLQNP